jgi:hypothetical protein
MDGFMVVGLGWGRRLLASGSVRFVRYVQAGYSTYAVLSPWGGTADLFVLVGLQGRPLPGVRGGALAAVRRANVEGG